MAKKYKNTVHKNPFREDRPKKASPLIPAAIVALSLVVVILLSVFLHNFYGVIHLTTTSAGNNVYDKRNKITYDLAPMCYQPVKIIDKKNPYALFGKTEFYKLEGIGPKSMISTSEDGIFDLYVNSEITLPSLEKFDPVATAICEVDLVAIAIGALDEEQSKTISQGFVSGENTAYPDDIDPDSVLYLYFVSEEYSYIYYYITYFRTESGGRYLYDRAFGKCVNIGEMYTEELG